MKKTANDYDWAHWTKWDEFKYDMKEAVPWIIFGVIVCLVMFACFAKVKMESDDWNNGYHEKDGGKWCYEQAVGHRVSSTYIYSCDICGTRIELGTLYEEGR